MQQKEIEEVNYTKFCRIGLSHYYNRDIPVLISCDEGDDVGKSVKNMAKHIAEKNGWEFVDWKRCSIEKQKEIVDNPGDYFVYKSGEISNLEGPQSDPPVSITSIDYEKAQIMLFVECFNDGSEYYRNFVHGFLVEEHDNIYSLASKVEE